MATRGVFQLTKLSLYYCEVGGSSTHVRNFIQSGNIIEYASANSRFEIEVKVRNGHHPYIRGHYISGAPKQICLKNAEQDYLLKMMDMLKNSSGRKIVPLRHAVITQAPSVQGIWTPMLNLEEDFPRIKFVKE